jgi:hypothetical protein
MAAEKRRRCKATSKQSGKRCKNKAVRGSDYCRLHGGGAVGNKGGKGVPKGTPKPPGAGGPPPKGNTNALKHGAYSSRLPAEEIPLYEELLARYKKDVHEPSETDLMTLERLALYETKLRVAVAGGAQADALDVLDRLLNRNLKALQVTRESKETTRTTGATPAEVMGALLARVRERGLLPAPVPVEAEVIDVEVVEVQEDSDRED